MQSSLVQRKCGGRRGDISWDRASLFLFVGLWCSQSLLNHLLVIFEASNEMSDHACSHRRLGLPSRVHERIRDGCFDQQPMDCDEDDEHRDNSGFAVAEILDAVCREGALAMLELNANSLSELCNWMSDVQHLRWALQQPPVHPADVDTAAASACKLRKLDLTRQLTNGLFSETIALAEKGSWDKVEQLPPHLSPSAVIGCPKEFRTQIGGFDTNYEQQTLSLSPHIKCFVNSREGLEMMLQLKWRHNSRTLE